MKLDERTFWSIYNIIREIEYTSGVLKTDLDLRPMYNKTNDASISHLSLGILAYWPVATIRYQLKQKGVISDWCDIVRKMNTQKCVITSVVNIKRKTISIRQYTKSAKEIKAIYDLLHYKHTPFIRKKPLCPHRNLANPKSLKSDCFKQKAAMWVTVAFSIYKHFLHSKADLHTFS